MFYRCKQIEGGERLLNLDRVRYLAPIQYQGQPATMVKLTNDKSFQIYGSFEDHCNALSDCHLSFYRDAPQGQSALRLGKV